MNEASLHAGSSARVGIRSCGVIPRFASAFVGGVVSATLGNFDICMRHNKLADGHIKSKAVDRAIDSEHENRGGAIHAIP